MKHFLHNYRVIAVIIAFVFVQGLRAGNEIVLKQGQTGKLVVNESTYNHLQVSNTISALQYFDVKTNKGEFTQIQAQAYGGSDNYGSPQLPVLHKLIEIPQGATPVVNIISYTVNEYNLSEYGIKPLFPAQPPVSKSTTNPDFIYYPSAYQQNIFTGGELATVDVLGMLRGTRLGRLNIAPVQYNAVTNTIRVYNNLVIDVTFKGANISLTKSEKKRYDSPYFRSVYNRLINYQQTDNMRDTMSKFPVKYVIVSPQMFHDALQPFVAWKKKKGFTVVEAYTNNPAVGTTTTSIKNYLHGLYTAATPGNPAPSFVLFVGDVAQIPAFSCNDGHVSDLYYCEYSGDYLPEVYYGRFSATTVAQLQPQIDKTLEYEQYIMPDPSFLNQVVMVAGADDSHQMTWGNGQINYGTSLYFNAAHGLTSHTYLQPEPSGANYSQQIHTDVSNGVGYANYTAHGSPDGWYNPSFSISDIPNLQNAHKYPLMVGNCCQTSTYNEDCFGEELLRASNKGALGYIGGSNSSYWDEDYWWGVGVGAITANPTYNTTTLGAYDRTFHDHGEPYDEWYSSMDQMIFAGNLAVTESSSSMKQYYWEIYCLMGDPSLMVYFSEPPAMSVTYSQLMPLSSNSFTVNAEPYAYVAISKDGVLYGAAEADATGLAVVSLTPITVPGMADVVVTKQNRQPFISTVVVASPDGPYVLFDSYEVDDSNGNNNQMAEFGENILFDVSLHNVGNSDATNVTSTISTSDEYLTLTDVTELIPDIQSQTTVTANGAFAATLAAYIPDEHVAHFTISSSCDTNTWNSEFSLILYAPELATGQFTIDDAAGGNGNGRIDPGETVNIIIPTINSGHCFAVNTTGNLVAAGSNVTLNTSSVNLGTLAAGASMNAVFSLTISPSAENGSIIQLHYISNSGLYTTVTNLSLSVGQLVEDFETGNFTKYAWQMGETAPWTITTSAVQQGSFSAISGTIADSQTSELFISANVLINDTISFYRKVSSEAGYDFLKFYVDGQALGSWDGTVAWGKVSYPISAGQHTFKWSYEKDYSTSSGSDQAGIDYIVFPSFSNGGSGGLSVSAVALPSAICPGGQTQLYSFGNGGSGNYAYSWSPSTGLSDTTIFNPIANPETTTTYTARIDNLLAFATTDLTITVEPLPQTPVVTQAGSILQSSSATGNQWYNSNGPIIGAIEQTYTPAHTDAYYVIVSSAIGCESLASNSVYVAFTGLDEIKPQMAIYPNPYKDNFMVVCTFVNETKAKVAVYNSLGNEIKVLSDWNSFTAGQHIIDVQSLHLPVGVYYCKLFTGDKVSVTKLIRTR
jgi:hypothetical protein